MSSDVKARRMARLDTPTDLKVNAVERARHLNGRRTGLTVLRNVGQAFLGDAEETQRDIGRQRWRDRRMRKRDRNLMPIGEFRDELLQRGNQAQVIEGRRMQTMGQAVHIIGNAARVATKFLERRPDSRGDRSVGAQLIDLDGQHP